MPQGRRVSVSGCFDDSLRRSRIEQCRRGPLQTLQLFVVELGDRKSFGHPDCPLHRAGSGLTRLVRSHAPSAALSRAQSCRTPASILATAWCAASSYRHLMRPARFDVCARRRPGARGPRCRPTAHSRVAGKVGRRHARPVDAMCCHRNSLPDTMTPNESRDVYREYTASRISLAPTDETGGHRRESCWSASLHGFSRVARSRKTFRPPLQARVGMTTQHTSIYSEYAIDLGLCTIVSASAERVALAVLTAARARAVLASRGGVVPAPPALRIRRRRMPLGSASGAFRPPSACALRVRSRILAVRRHHSPDSCAAPCEHCTGVRSGRRDAESSGRPLTHAACSSSTIPIRPSWIPATGETTTQAPVTAFPGKRKSSDFAGNRAV